MVILAHHRLTQKIITENIIDNSLNHYIHIKLFNMLLCETGDIDAEGRAIDY